MDSLVSESPSSSATRGVETREVPAATADAPPAARSAQRAATAPRPRSRLASERTPAPARELGTAQSPVPAPQRPRVVGTIRTSCRTSVQAQPPIMFLMSSCGQVGCEVSSGGEPPIRADRPLPQHSQGRQLIPGRSLSRSQRTLEPVTSPASSRRPRFLPRAQFGFASNRPAPMKSTTARPSGRSAAHRAESPSHASPRSGGTSSAGACLAG